MTHYTTLVQRCRSTNSLLADEINLEFQRLERLSRLAAVWRPIEEAPYLGEPFLAAVEVRAQLTKTFSHFDYAVLYMDEGKLYFYDDQSDTGWGLSDYTLCLPFSSPRKKTEGNPANE